MKTPVVDSASGDPFLRGYFPRPIQERFGDRLRAHPLGRYIVATASINHVVNHAGISLIPRLMVAGGKDLGAIVDAYLAAEEAGECAAARRLALEADNPVRDQHAALLQIEEALERDLRARLG